MSEKYPGTGGYTHECTKVDCYYCYITNRTDRDDIPFRKNGWSKNDMAYLESNLGQVKIDEIERVLKRSRNTIWTKAYYVRKSHEFKERV